LSFVTLAALAACGGDGQPSATPTPSAAGTTGGTTTPTPVGVAGAIPLALADGVDLPDNLALIIETGCIGCDGPTTSLLRVYRAADGNYATDTLFTPATVGVGPITVQTNKGPEERQPGIAGFAITADASDIVVGTTYGLDLGPPTETTTLFRSRDGGITWSDFGSLEAGDFMSEDLVDGQVIVGHYDANTQTVAPSSTPFYPPAAYRLYPSGDPIQRPPGANAFWSPTRLSDGTVGWRTDDGRLLSSAGDELLSVNGRLVAYRNSSFNPPGANAVVWSPDGSATTTSYLQVVDPNGKSSATYSLPEFVIPGVWASGSLALGNVSLPEPSPLPSGGVSMTTVPALIDLKDLAVKPVTGLFGDAAFPRGRNFVAATMAGPRARVADTGSCLNVRAEASATAAVVECAADGVLLENLGPASDPAWLHVRTLAGNEGYASVDYLQVVGQPMSQN